MQIINYEAFVNDIEYRLEHNKCSREDIECARDVLEIAKLYIFELSTEWIKCSDRLPDNDGKYLITKLLLDEPKTSVCSFSKDLYKVDDFDFYKYRYKRKANRAGWYDYDGEYGLFYEIGDVIAWMPLPEAYKEEEDA